jgi:hypothetical protein
MPIRARIWWEETSQSYAASWPYNEKFLEALKILIPSGDRTIDGTTKIWYVQEKYGLYLRQLAESSFGVGCVSFTSKEVAQQARAYQSQARGAQGSYLQPSVGTTEDCVVAFFTLIPYNVAKRAYLSAAQELHPDKPQGDAEKMTKLNELWKRIEKELYKR